MEAIAIKIGSVLLYALLFSFLALTVLGLAGNWLIALVALIIRLTGWGELTWTWFLVIVALAALGEVVESLLGLVVVVKRGGTRWGVIGAFLGGIAGVILGGPVAPPFGSLLLGFVGAFAGAAAGEFLRTRHGGEAVRVGFWAFVGKTLAAMAKVACGVGMIAIIIARTW
jgi:uncharacterized protein YqgC (DUF456 family)